MKLIDTIAYICYWVTILFLLVIFIILPILFTNYPGFYEMFIKNRGVNPIIMTLMVLDLGVVFLWVYCIWFLFKFDRYSKSIFPLFFLNALYAPIYYYRVKIKKRPLRNKIFYPIIEETKRQILGDDEFKELTKSNIISVLELWSSEKEQIEYQENQSDTNVSMDLFEQWKDFYSTSSDTIKEAFAINEIHLLDEFDNALTENSEKLGEKIPFITEFILTAEWKELNTLAKRILLELKE